MSMTSEIDRLFGVDPYPKETEMPNDITLHRESSALTFDQVMTVGELLARSGYFSGVKDTAQAVAKILFGQEMGLGPTASLRMIHTFEVGGGRTAMVPHYTLILALIERSARYDYRVLWGEDEQKNPTCTVEFYRDGELRGTETVDRMYALKAGLLNKPNWQGHFKDMLFATAVQKGARKYAPEIAAGFAEDYDLAEVPTPTPPADPHRVARELAEGVGMTIPAMVSLLLELGVEEFDVRQVDAYRELIHAHQTKEDAPEVEVTIE